MEEDNDVKMVENSVFNEDISFGYVYNDLVDDEVRKTPMKDNLLSIIVAMTAAARDAKMSKLIEETKTKKAKVETLRQGLITTSVPTPPPDDTERRKFEI